MDPSERARRILEADRKARAESRVVTVPNIISILRLIVLMPLFVVVLLAWHSPAWALIVAIVLAFSDFVDGYIARKFHQVTKLGQALDPVADRISQIVVSATMVVGGYVPIWMAVVIAASDLVLGIALAFRGRRAIPVRWIGRIRTLLLMIGLPLVLLVAAVDPSNEVLVVLALVVVGVGVVMHALADLVYTWSLVKNTAQQVRDAHPAAD